MSKCMFHTLTLSRTVLCHRLLFVPHLAAIQSHVCTGMCVCVCGECVCVYELPIACSMSQTMGRDLFFCHGHTPPPIYCFYYFKNNFRNVKKGNESKHFHEFENK